MNWKHDLWKAAAVNNCWTISSLITRGDGGCSDIPDSFELSKEWEVLSGMHNESQF